MKTRSINPLSRLIIVCSMLWIAYPLPARSQTADSIQIQKWLSQADDFYDSYQYDSALFLVKQSTRYALQIHEEPSFLYGLCLLKEARIYNGQRNLEDARVIIDSVHQLEFLSRDFYLQAELRNQRSYWFRQQGDLDSALHYISESFELWKKRETDPDLQWVEFSYIKGIYQYLMFDFEEAMVTFEESLEILNKIEENSENFLFVRLYNGLALSYNGVGDFRKAIDIQLYKMDLIKKIKGPDDQMIATTYYNLGLNYSQIGEQEQAIQAFKTAMDLRLKVFPPDHPYIADYLSNIGKNYGDLGDYETGLPFLEQATPIYLDALGEDHFRTGQHFSFLGTAYFRLDRFEAAKAYYQKSLVNRINAVGDHDNNVAFLYMQLSKIESMKGDYGRAYSYVNAGLRSLYYHYGADPSDFIAPNMLVHVLESKAQLLRQWYLPGDECYRDSIDQLYIDLFKTVDRLRADFKGDLSKAEVMEMTSDIYESALDFYFDCWNFSGHDVRFYNRALQITERKKNNNLRVQLNDQKFFSEGLLSPETKEEEWRLKHRLADLETQSRSSHITSDSLHTLRNLIFLTRDSFEQFLDHLESDFPAYYVMKYSVSIPQVEKIQNQLSGDLAIVDLFRGNNVIYKFYIDKENISFEREQNLEDLDTTIAHIRDSFFNTEKEIASVKDLQEILQWISNKILPTDVVKPQAGIQKICFIPDGGLSLLPYDCLLMDGRYLIEDFSIYSQHSLDLLFTSDDQARIKTTYTFSPRYSFDSIDLDTGSDFSKASTLLHRSGHLPLPGASSEAKQIAEMTGGHVYVGSNVTESLFKLIAPKADIIHLSMHAIADHLSPLESTLLFSKPEKDQPDDGLLHAFEILNMTLTAQLVVLSACNTGLGPIHAGEGANSLGRAFAFAGVPSMILTLWKVPDASSAQILTKFYQYLIGGSNKDDALRKAKLDYLNEVVDPSQTHPIYWAGFSLLGNPQTLVFEKGRRSFGLMGSLGILIFGFISVAIYRFIRN